MALNLALSKTDLALFAARDLATLLEELSSILPSYHSSS
jgi:hypothetical protein